MFTVTTMTTSTAKLVTPAVTTAAASIAAIDMKRTLALKRNQVILDESFIRSGNVQRLCAKRRFTLAHECAHQILFQLESEEVKASCEMKYSARTAYTPRELKTREDWNEWQANVLGAAILLPQKEVDLAMRRFAETPLINYEGGIRMVIT